MIAADGETGELPPDLHPFGKKIQESVESESTPPLEALRWLRQRCVETVKNQIRDQDEAREYLNRLAAVHRYLEGSTGSKGPGTTPKAWDLLREVSGELGLSWETGEVEPEVVEVSQPARGSAPESSEAKWKRQVKKAFKTFKRNFNVLGGQRKELREKL
jgi:hypothetical protein